MAAASLGPKPPKSEPKKKKQQRRPAKIEVKKPVMGGGGGSDQQKPKTERFATDSLSLKKKKKRGKWGKWEALNSGKAEPKPRQGRSIAGPRTGTISRGP